nr:Gag-Pol polyprotein [Tanacetum cinerariifolium]
NETFHVQTDDELTEKELKQIEADDQAIQTILLGLPEDIYAAVEWSRHVSIVHQTKDLHTAYYTQLYDFLKYNQKEVDDLKAERLARTQDPLALMATSNNPYTFPVADCSTGYEYGSRQTYADGWRNQVAQNAIQNLRIQNVGNQYGQIVILGTNQNPNGNGNLVAACAEGNATGHNNLDEIKEVNANCILMANLQQASTSGIHTDKALEEQYTELLEPIPEPHQVPQNDNDVISEVTSMEQTRGTVEQHPVNAE